MHLNKLFKIYLKYIHININRISMNETQIIQSAFYLIKYIVNIHQKKYKMNS